MSSFKHGDGGRKTRSPEYRAWAHAIDRCYNPKDRGYKNYGARGIRMHVKWRNDFAAFLTYVGRKPSPAHFLDRINNNGNYEPGNCKWSTPLESGRNTRTIIKVRYRGRLVLLHELPSVVNTKVLRERIITYGWSVKEAISTPLQTRKFKGVKPWDRQGISKSSWYRANKR